MVFVPHQMRASIGDESEQLDAASSRRINNAVDLVTKAGRSRTTEAP